MAQYQTFATTKDSLYNENGLQIAGDNDFYLDKNGNLAMATDAEALSNITLNVVRTARGEIKYDLARGIPYFQTVFAGQQYLPIWKKTMTDEALTVDGILSVNAFEYKVQGGTLTYTMALNTIFGGINING